MPDGTYAPQSPDLSSFLTSPSPQKKPPTSSYVPKSPNLSAFNSPPPAQTSYPAYNYPPSQGLGLAFQPQSPQRYHPQQSYGQYQQPYDTQIPPLPSAHHFLQQQGQQQYQTYAPPLPEQAPYNYLPAPEYTQFDSNPVDMSSRSRRGAGEVKTENGAAAAEVPKDLGPSKGIEIKTKFPVARIKRIMQADEDVGKVAQVTPVAVSKALELFMIALVTRSSEIARSGSSKRVTAQHLKKAVQENERFDFLTEIAEKVADGPESKKAAGKEGEGSSEDEEMKEEGGGKKKKGGRRKKAE